LTRRSLLADAEVEGEEGPAAGAAPALLNEGIAGCNAGLT